ncbi:hypothetical protein PAXRUDRAFT_176923, partial [Paxillus rubicundulus Ve08.2h10]
PGAQIDELMDVCAEMPGHQGPPPFANHQDLYKTIETVSEGGAPWECLSVSHVDADTLPADDPSVPTWMQDTHEVWFRCPESLLDQQILNSVFDGHMDYVPWQVFGDQHQHIWSSFMSGNWAWTQCNELAEDPENHGAMFVPIILGSDKTTVSVVTGNNEYHPVYISTGNVHNDMWHAHGEAVSLVGFLSMPKSKSSTFIKSK